jgi:CSLREA domain-containing protein
MKHSKSLLLVAVAATLTGCPAVLPIFSVDTTQDTNDASPGDGLCADLLGQCSLRAAVEEGNAGQGAEIRLVAGQSYALGAAGGSLALTQDTVVSGAFAADGASVTNGANAVIHPTKATRIFELGTSASASSAGVNVTLTARALTLRGVRLPPGGGSARAGGAVDVSAGSTFVGENVNVLDNEAERGAAFRNAGTIRITGGNLSQNRCNQVQATRGGAIVNNGTIELANVSLTSNTCDSGGAIHSAGGSVTLTGVTIANNRAHNDGAAITANNTRVVITSSNIVDNNQEKAPNRPDSAKAGAINVTGWDRAFFDANYVPNAPSGQQVFGACSGCHGATSEGEYTFALINPAKYSNEALAAKIHSDRSQHFPPSCSGEAARAKCSMDVAGYLKQNATGPVTHLIFGDAPGLRMSGSLLSNNWSASPVDRNCQISGAALDPASTGNLVEDSGSLGCEQALPAGNTRVSDIATDSWKFSYVDERNQTVVPSLCQGQTPPGGALKYSPACWSEFSFSSSQVVARCKDEAGIDCRDSRAWL